MDRSGRTIRIGAAQSVSIPGDVAANVDDHLRFIGAARRASVDVLVFPELSLSGYELPLLRACALLPEAQALLPIRDLARSAAMNIVVGAPIANGSGLPFIGAILFAADGGASVYRKQYLHPGEEKFAAGAEPVPRLHAIRGEEIALAICADILEPRHAAAAAGAGASLYLAGVLVSVAGYAADSAIMQRHAAQYGMGALMANYGGPSGGHVSAGRSAVWAPGGELVAEAPASGRHLVVASKSAAGWSGEVIGLAS